jgi:hypothetical protein
MKNKPRLLIAASMCLLVSCGKSGREAIVTSLATDLGMTKSNLISSVVKDNILNTHSQMVMWVSSIGDKAEFDKLVNKSSCKPTKTFSSHVEGGMEAIRNQARGKGIQLSERVLREGTSASDSRVGNTTQYLCKPMFSSDSEYWVIYISIGPDNTLYTLQGLRAEPGIALIVRTE